MLEVDALSCYASPLDIIKNHVHITPQEKTEFQATIHDDPLLCSLVGTTLASWPEDINDAPHPLCTYHAHCDALTVKDGLILHGEALVIQREREKVFQAIHEGHLGITKCQYHAEQFVYWPGINSDIKCTV